MATYKYGDKTHLEIVLHAALSTSKPVSRQEIDKIILQRVKDFKVINTHADLSRLTVNSYGRSGHHGNKEPRRCDQGHPNDQLYRIGKGRDALYTRYVPKEHGIWELRPDAKGTLRPYEISLPFEAEHQQAREDIDKSDGWISAPDARKKVMELIVRREGQPKFRKELLQAYAGQCAISGCDVEVLLEAANIVPYQGIHTNHVSNGLLLRADLHKLFDLQMLCIQPSNMQIKLHPTLMKSEYKQFDGASLRTVVDPADAPSKAALEQHYISCASWVK